MSGLSPLFTTRGGKLKLFLGSLGVLCVGAWLAPRAPSRATQAPLNLPVPRLQSEIERREPARLFERVPEVGVAVGGFVVAFLAPPAPRLPSAPDHVWAPAERATTGYGLVVSPDGDVLTNVAALAGSFTPEAERAGGQRLGGRLTAVDPETGFALVRLDGADLPAPPAVAASPPMPGELLVGAGPARAHAAAWPVVLAAVAGAEYVAAPMGGTLLPGTPVFSTAREVVAIADASGRLFAVPFALERLGRLVDDGTPVPVTLGLALQPLEPPLAAILGEGGVLVSDVVPDGPGARAGLRPADVITTIGGDTVGDPEAARLAIARLRPETPAVMTARRDRRALELQVEPRPVLPLPAGEPPVQAHAADASRPLGGAVFEAPALARAALDPSARVLAIGGREATATNFRVLLRRVPPPRLVYVEHAGRRFFVVIEAGS